MYYLLAIGLGGFLGAVSRYLLSTWVQRLGSFPFGTLAVNVLGCFAIGMLWALAREREEFSPNVQAFLAVGFLGSFTTFSTFGLESLNLLRNDHLAQVGASIIANVTLGLLAVALGRALVLRFL